MWLEAVKSGEVLGEECPQVAVGEAKPLNEVILACSRSGKKAGVAREEWSKRD